MDQETLFTASKWEILKLLSEQPLSPIELAARSNTSVANISQQLRLLEMAGLVASERVPNRDKGQPRILYSLAGNHSFLIATTNDFVEKKLFKLSVYNKIILKIWFYKQPELHYYLEKAFWSVEQFLPSIDAIAFDEGSSDPLTIILFTRDEKLKGKVKPLSITGPDGGSRAINFLLSHPDKTSKDLLSLQLYSVYDPGNVLSGVREKK
jgi:DNA-binding transcriptional ArsR family regulator